MIKYPAYPHKNPGPEARVRWISCVRAGCATPRERLRNMGSPYKTVRVNNFNELHIISSGST
jgi:hypothetical protein